jgi:hypothetical protein
MGWSAVRRFAIGVSTLTLLSLAALSPRLVSAQTPTPTPTCGYPQTWALGKGATTPTSTPLPTPVIECPGAPDPYAKRGTFTTFLVPVWRFDVTNNGVIDANDAAAISTFKNVGAAATVFPTPVFATPTPCGPSQQWSLVWGEGTPTSTPVAQAWCEGEYHGDPYDGLPGALATYRIPVWRFDLNRDGVVNNTDLIALYTYEGDYGGTAYDWPTPSPVGTCTPGGECEATATPWGGSNLTVEQGADFVNGITAVAIFAGVLAACGVAGVVGVALLFFHRGR